MENEESNSTEMKTVIEMIVMILEGSKDKEEALEKIKSLSILQE